MVPGIKSLARGLDEVPMVYKDIQQVMASQKSIIDVVGSFQPKIVRMCGDTKFNEVG